MSDDERLTITQYRLLGQRQTTVLCHAHSVELLQMPRRVGRGSGSTYAPSLMSCDRCDD